MAVQLGRLSLWLATLAADRPLTFLDHRLRAGDSLVGASPWDVLRQPPPGRRARARSRAAAALRQDDGLDDGDWSRGRRAGCLSRRTGRHPGAGAREGAGAGAARAGRLGADAMEARRRPLVRGLVPRRRAQSRLAAAFRTLVDAVLGRQRRLLSDRDGQPAAGRGRAICRRRTGSSTGRSSFPRSFTTRRGGRCRRAGFDAVIGNPPWEMLRGDHGTARTRADARLAARASPTSPGAGVYRLQGDGHVNLYQLFVERALALLRPGGRLGLILPSGFAIDHGCAALRRALLDRTQVDTFLRLREPRGPVSDPSRPQVPAGHRAQPAAHDGDVPAGSDCVAPRPSTSCRTSAAIRCRPAVARLPRADERRAAGRAGDPHAARTSKSCPPSAFARAGAGTSRRMAGHLRARAERHRRQAPFRRGRARHSGHRRQAHPAVRRPTRRARRSRFPRIADRLTGARDARRRPRLAYRDVASRPTGSR